MSMTKELAKNELSLRILRETEHAKNAMNKLAKTSSDMRIRRPGHGVERATSIYWRRARRHLRNVETARNLLKALTG